MCEAVQPILPLCELAYRGITLLQKNYCDNTHAQQPKVRNVEGRHAESVNVVEDDFFYHLSFEGYLIPLCETEFPVIIWSGYICA
jgi:hypothetical protein